MLIVARHFQPAQVRHFVPLGICALLSRFRHFRRCSLPLFIHRASTFLPPLPQGGFAVRLSSGFRRNGTMKALNSCPARTCETGLAAYSALPSGHPIPNHAVRPDIAFIVTSACPACSRLRHERAGSPRSTANRFRFATGCPFASSCSPPRIAAAQLLSTSQAVTARGRDLHPADKASSRTHSFPRRREPIYRVRTSFQPELFIWMWLSMR